ncbi:MULTISPECIES: ATP-binding protein [Trichocoleus]|uniref:histidine kinase n=1 Tax=Trichocoleus desertorum GB2-A4 TaxID=2933944 RepID=A0ABV0JCI8_9CYAN|nr:ATP-binding protein [Trichocoleus sp. FACHB-46]MBD1864152.1 PAS domain S-box protein [Trichocoleus sp. FACHB-46]
MVSQEELKLAVPSQQSPATEHGEAWFRKLADNLPGMIYQFRLSPDGAFSFPFVSLGCQELFELEPHEIRENGLRLVSLIHPEDLPGFDQSVAHSAQTLNPWRWEGRFCLPSGQIKWIEAASRPERYPNGDIVWDGMLMDVTRRRQAEEAQDQTQAELQAQQELSQLILNSMNDGVIVADEAGKFLVFNPAAEKLFGNGAMEIDQADWSEHYGLFLPDTVTPFPIEALPLVRTLQGEEPQNVEMFIRHAQAPAGLWLLISGKPLKDATGNLKGGMIVCRDVSDRKATEAQLQDYAERQAMLNRLATQIRQSLNLDIVIATTLRAVRDLLEADHCTFCWFNPEVEPPTWEVVKESKRKSYSSFLGLYPADIVGSVTRLIREQPVIQIDTVAQFSDPIYRSRLRSLGIKSAILLPIPTNSERIGCLACYHLSQAHSWTASEIELLQAVIDQLAIALNQAELYQQSQTKAQELAQTLQELQRTQSQMLHSEKMSSLGQLVAGVAHEINNPVNFIYGNLTHAEDYTQDLLRLLHLYQKHYSAPHPEIRDEAETIDLEFLQADLPKLLTSMRVGADRIQKIVTSLRTFSRMDEAEMKEVDIHEGIDSTLMILQNRLKAKSDRPEIQVIKQYISPMRVECYAGQLNQVFMNILANAIDALEESFSKRILDKAPTITICTERVNCEWVRIAIADNGPGIPLDVQKQLFDPFFTTKPLGKGIGMGMAISHQIIMEKHRGNLICCSAAGEGTEFIIQIPSAQSVVKQ